jgi:glycosyltransferase involved in cell wall biosynthesis
LTWEKDPLGQLDVAELILAEVPDAHLILVGEGPLATEARAHAARSAHAPRVHFAGFSRHVGDFLAAADVFLFASREDGMEGMPASIIEAGAAGLPTAAYSLAGVPEVVTNGVTGLLVRPGDRSALANAASQLLRDRPLRTRIGDAARSRCVTKFAIEQVAAEYARLFDDIRPSKHSNHGFRKGMA